MQTERIGWCEDCKREQTKENLCPYPKIEGYVQMHQCNYFISKVDHTICEYRQGQHYCLSENNCSQKVMSEAGSPMCVCGGTECELLHRIVFNGDK